MSIKDEMNAELKDAMRAKDRRRLDVIRAVQTEVSRARSAPGFSGELDDALYEKVISSFVKKMEKARQEFEDLGDRGRDHVDKLAFEIDYLARWLPKALGEAETRALVVSAIEELGADDPKMAGRVVGHIMKAGAEGLDGGLVNKLVREALAGE